MSAIDRASAPAGLLSLPLEIRLEIYSYLLYLPPYSKYQRRPSHIHTALLLANRQISYEATPLLYAHNTFIAHPSMLASFPRLRAWYGPLKEASVLPRIRRFHIQVRLDCDVPYDKATVARAFSGLEELTIEVVQTMFLGSGCANLRRFEAVRGVSRVKVIGSTTGFEEYIAWLRQAMKSDPEADVAEFVSTDPTWPERMALAC